MVEQTARLKEKLAALGAEIESMEPLDEESRVLLERARDDIQRALEDQQPPPSDLQARLRGAASRFELRYPALTAAVNRLAEALADMGF